MEVKVSKSDVQSIIDTHIQRAVVDGLSNSKGDVLETLVTAALTAKSGSYNRDTILAAEAKKMITAAAREALAEWLDTQREVIKEAVTKKMNATEAGFVDGIADRIVDSMSNNFYVSATLKVADDD